MFAKERKRTEEAGSSRWSFATIPAPPSPLFWSSGEPSSLQMTICKGIQEHGGGWIIWMIICNNPCSYVPLILVIWRTVLFVNDHLQRNRGIIVARNHCREGQLSRGTIVARDIVGRDIVPRKLVARDIDIWWHWVNIGRYWLVFCGTGSVWGTTGWYLVILGQYNLVLFGIKWYWVDKGLLCLYILKKINGDVNQPTDRPTNRQGE